MPINKVTLFPYQDTGVGFYRILQPGKFMKREGLIKEVMSLPFSGENQGHNFDFKDDTYLGLTKDTDVMHSTIVYDPDYIVRLLNLKKHRDAKLIFDIDDNLYSVPIDNPAASEVKRLKDNFEACLRIADGVTVSVPSLKRLYAPLSNNIFVNPNGIDFSMWDKLKTKKGGRKIRIGWRGAYGHIDDFNMIKPALEAIKKDFNVEIVTLGSDVGGDEHHEWVSLFDFPDKLASMNIDIAIVPLVDSSYNRCKSNLAFLEYSALKVPCILSPVENQKGMPAIEATTNWEWYESLKKLIQDKDNRIAMGERAYQFVKENYNCKKQAHDLYNWMDKVEFRELKR